jgi:hypothetical protein
MIPPRLLEAGNWAGIEDLAREAAALGRESVNKGQQ